jgi:hypothetical protein
VLPSLRRAKLREADGVMRIADAHRVGSEGSDVYTAVGRKTHAPNDNLA